MKYIIVGGVAGGATILIQLIFSFGNFMQTYMIFLTNKNFQWKTLSG